MTGPSDHESGLPASGPDPDAQGPRTVGGPPASTFSLEGRAAPALYLIGWVGSTMGLAVLFVSIMAARNGASPWLFLGGLIVLVVGLVAAAGSQAVERGRRADLAYRGPAPVLAFVVVLALTLLAIVIVLAPLAALGLDVQSPAATTLSLLLTTAMYVVVIRLLVVGPGALSWADMGLRRPPMTAIPDLAWGGILALPVLIVTLLLSGVLASFLEPEPIPLPEARDAAGLILNLVSAAILAPLGEELFFRGFTTTAWMRVYGSWSAIVRGAVFFAFAHNVTIFDVSFETGVQRAVFSFLVLMPVSLTLGWVYLRRHSLYAPIGLHAVFNGIQVLLLYAVAGTG